MVVSTADVQPTSSGQTKTKKKRPAGSSSGKSRRSQQQQQQQQQQTPNNGTIHYVHPRRTVLQQVDEEDSTVVATDQHLYDVVKSLEPSNYQNVTTSEADNQQAVYQNMDDMYDRPVAGAGKNVAALLVQSHYQNFNFDEVVEKNNHDSAADDNDPTYLNIDTYDIPVARSNNLYDHPRNNNNNNHINSSNSDYDYPKGLIPLSARLLLNASRGGHRGHLDDNDDQQSGLDSDSGLSELANSRPGSSPDEGIGTELLDQKGLGVITEEEEEALAENCYSNAVVVQQHQQKSKKKSRSTNSKSETKNRTPSVGNKTNRDEPTKATPKKGDVVITAPGGVPQEEKTQKDRCIEVYHETLRQRNSQKKAKMRELLMVSVQSAKEDVDSHSTIRRMKKLLPSVRALRSQFETKSSNTVNENASKDSNNSKVRKWKSTSNFLQDPLELDKFRSRSSSLEEISSSSASCSCSSSSCSSSMSTSSKDKKHNYNNSPVVTPVIATTAAAATALQKQEVHPAQTIQPIVPANGDKDSSKEYDMYRPRKSTAQWNPMSLLEELYRIQEPMEDEDNEGKDNNGTGDFVNMEGSLDKLPSGRRKATFWNAWKRRFFKLKDGYIYCYQNSQLEKANIILELIGGQVEMDNNMISIDDGKGNYMVVKGSSKAETDRWYQALLTHVDSSKTGKLMPTWVLPVSRNPKFFKDIIVIDLGSSSIRAGILCAHQATLPQVFFPSVAAVDKNSGQMIAFGTQAVMPDVRAHSTLAFPLRVSSKISKYMLDMDGVTGLIRTAIRKLNVDPSSYGIQVSLPRNLNQATQTELVRLLFEEFGMQSVNLTHQSVLSLLSYNSTSGIVVDIGERIDIVPIMDGYMLETSASQVPYGGQQLVDHLRHFLVQQRCSLITDVESYLIRQVLEKLAYVAGPDPGAYATELNRARNDPSSVRGTVDLKPFSNGHLPWDNVSLELGRFQVTEGLFHPEAWGLDNPGVQKLVHRAVQECGVDIRKEMVRSIFLSGGVTMLPNFAERLEAEVDRLTPSHLVPKVHASPYRYHAAFIGACVLSNSATYEKSRISREEWRKNGPESVRKWIKS